MLLVSGGWEYIRPNGNPGLAKTMVSLSRAYNAMHYDVGLLTAREAKALAGDDVPRWPWQKTAGEEPFTVRELPDGRKVGFLRYPSLPDGADAPSPELAAEVSRRVKAERGRVDLLIGLCDWGWVAENDYLRSNPEQVPDMLFGSGGGSGINGRVLADGRCLWVRPYDRGRSLVEITVLQWPERENSFAWEEAKNYTSSSIGMNDAIKDNPEIGALFQ
ncbi:hypothetical protein [Pseudodesulfovibrio mercurii]|uniref:UshA-like (seleno)protein family 2 n=1 Tax=Pseudodesulfovibrio mercurii TaxID=641491 RepID=UPI0002D2B42F|nr:hypothetical protein [Pseudodesulfovibrio mercurii]